MKIQQKVKHNVLNILGWRTNRHIVVIESDDWGSIRMPSVEEYDTLVKKGVTLGKYGYENSMG